MGAVERLRSGAEGMRPEPIDVPALLAEAAARFRAQAEAAGITLTVADVPAARARDLSLAADRLGLERMLGNLLANALAAVGTGGTVRLEAGEMTIGMHTPAATVPPGGRPPGPVPAIWFGVIDDGPGFPPGGADHAFERFWRGDEARSGPGTGLGLAIVRELAVAHGGSVYAENVSPHGARVGVILPRVPAIDPGGVDA
jgi:signal transduction histidine kinase